MGFRKRRRQRRQLGASARPTRERTGVPHIDPEAIRGPTDRIVTGFDQCGATDLVKPWRPGFPFFTEVRDAATGTPIRVRIEVDPDPSARSEGHASHELTLSKRFPTGRFDVVRLHPNAGLCMRPDAWRSSIRSLLTHELTHVTDSGLAKSKKAGPRGGDCRYYSNPHEVTAFLAQMRDDLKSWDKSQMLDTLHRKGFLKRPEDLLQRFDMWPYLKRCVTPAQKKRFLRMAALVWRELGFEARENLRRDDLGRVDWYHYAIEDEWKNVARRPPRIRKIQEAVDMGHGEVKFEAVINGQRVGELEAWAHPQGRSVQVSAIAVGPKGRGIGTKLYEAAARWACDVMGKPLASDEKRSADSEAFWKKQVKKKRARCEVRLVGEEAEQAKEDEQWDPPGASIYGRGGCERYRLTCPVPKTLAGRRQR